MIVYNLHNLVRIDVDRRVPAALREAIDFQIAHFRCATPHRRPTDGLAAIRVFPYEDFVGRRHGAIHEFHTCTSGNGAWMDDPTRRCAYVRMPNGFAAYADTPRLLINMLVQFLLVERGVTLVHAAAVADARGRVTLLPGPGGVGKTALVGSLVRHHGYRLLGDDIVGLSEDGHCWAYPRSFVLKAYHKTVYPELFDKLGISQTPPRPRVTRRALNVLADNMPLKGLARALLRRTGLLPVAQRRLAGQNTPPFLATVPVGDIFGAGCVLERGRIERVLYLERWREPEFRIESLPADAIVNRLISIIHHEWTDHMRHFWTLGATGIVDFPAYLDGVTGAARRAIADRPCQRLLIPAGSAPDQLAERFLEHLPPLLRHAA